MTWRLRAGGRVRMCASTRSKRAQSTSAGLTSLSAVCVKTFWSCAPWRSDVRVLQISTHTTLAPRYGGPLRSHHIVRCLESAGFEVSRLAVCWRTDHDVVDAREP